jgi:dihydrofolate reductase
VRRLSAFNNISLDGFFVDSRQDMSWAHGANSDAEFNDFVAGNAKGGGVLVFGRVTYEMMANYWPTEMAHEQNPVVAEQMNSRSKIVFSKTLEDAVWHNTTLISGDLISEMKKMKSASGADMVILGSGSIVSQLAAEGLIDEYQIVLNPIALGQGRTMFDTLSDSLKLKLTSSRAFSNGKVFLSYEPID